MNQKPPSTNTPVSLWRARAWLHVGKATDAAYGFGGPDVAEATGTAEEIGRALTQFLDSLEREIVEAERYGSGHFAVQVEISPLEGDPGSQTGAPGDLPADDPVRVWETSALVGNARGVFDGCYSFGNCKDDEGHLLGTAHELGVELARVLGELTRDDVKTMKYSTDRFFIQLSIELPPPD